MPRGSVVGHAVGARPFVDESRAVESIPQSIDEPEVASSQEGKRMRFHWMWMWLFAFGCLVSQRPAHAVPEFARQYAVSCQTCHSIAPRLNDFGQGFKANNYNWPGASPS